MKLNEKLRELRLQKNYSQSYVADKLHISRQAVSKWENGWASPDLENLKLLSGLYGVTVDELLGKTSAVTENISENNQEDMPKKAASDKERFEFELVLLFVVIVVSSLYSIAGIVVSLAVLIRICSRKGKFPLWFKGVTLFFLIVNILHCALVLNNLFFHLGKANFM